MIGETVTRLRSQATTDRYENATKDWTDPDELAIDGVAVSPRTTPDDTTNGREGVIIGLTLYCPPGTEILATDRVRVRGADYEVDGEPGVWRNPFTDAERGVELAVKRVEG